MMMHANAFFICLYVLFICQYVLSDSFHGTATTNCMLVLLRWYCASEKKSCNYTLVEIAFYLNLMWTHGPFTLRIVFVYWWVRMHFEFSLAKSEFRWFNQILKHQITWINAFLYALLNLFYFYFFSSTFSTWISFQKFK